MSMYAMAGWLILSISCQGDSPPPGDSPVQVCVVAILACERGNDVDPRLTDIAREVKKLETQLTSFRMAQRVCKSMPIGKAEHFELIDQEEISVKIRHGVNENNLVGVWVKVPGVGGITYQTKCGKFFPIITRYKTKDKERLIVAIMVRPCPGEEK
ncbi:MAG: hypothetical protein ACK4RK_16775 [Gemmataceae bacterium]